MGLREPPLSSKKFIAYMVAEITWKLLLFAMLLVFRDQITLAGVAAWWVMLTIVIVAGFLEIGFIGGQVWLDRYVKVAEMGMNKFPGGPGKDMDKPTSP
jgi:hypothetical protein